MYYICRTGLIKNKNMLFSISKKSANYTKFTVHFTSGQCCVIWTWTLTETNEKLGEVLQTVIFLSVLSRNAHQLGLRIARYVSFSCGLTRCLTININTAILNRFILHLRPRILWKRGPQNGPFPHLIAITVLLQIALWL